MKTNYVLIDSENVGIPQNIEILARDGIKVVIFAGKENPRNVPLATVVKMFKMGVQYVNVGAIGKNALDFTIAYYMGLYSANEEEIYFHIISKDHDYDSLIEHLKNERKTYARRYENLDEMEEKFRLIDGKVSEEERIQIAHKRLFAPKATRPRTRQKLANHVSAIFMKKLSEGEVEKVIAGLMKSGAICEDEKKRLVYSDEK